MFNFLDNKKLFSFGKLCLFIVFLFGSSFFAGNVGAIWQEPTAAPPNNNIDKPINEGSDIQTKTGGLILSTVTSTQICLTGGTPQCITNWSSSTLPAGTSYGDMLYYNTAPAGWRATSSIQVSGNNTVSIKNNLLLVSSTPPSVTDDKLYNYGGNLYWDGLQISGSGGTLPAGTSGQTLRNNGSGWVADSNLYNDGSHINLGGSNSGSMAATFNIIRTGFSGLFGPPLMNIGFGNTVDGPQAYNAIGIGTGVRSTNAFSLAIGNMSQANGVFSMALGNSVVVNGDHSLGIGLNGGVQIDRSGVMAILGGPVGINTVDPRDKLDVDAMEATSTAWPVRVRNTGVAYDGKVGIKFELGDPDSPTPYGYGSWAGIAGSFDGSQNGENLVFFTQGLTYCNGGTGDCFGGETGESGRLSNGDGLSITKQTQSTPGIDNVSSPFGLSLINNYSSNNNKGYGIRFYKNQLSLGSLPSGIPSDPYYNENMSINPQTGNVLSTGKFAIGLAGLNAMEQTGTHPYNSLEVWNKTSSSMIQAIGNSDGYEYSGLTLTDNGMVTGKSWEQSNVWNITHRTGEGAYDIANALYVQGKDSSNTWETALAIMPKTGNIFVGTNGMSEDDNQKSKHYALNVEGSITLGQDNAGTWDWKGIANEQRAVQFVSKGANTGYPDLLHTAGRMYGQSFGSGWSNQALVLEAAKNWYISSSTGNTAFNRNQLVLGASGGVSIGAKPRIDADLYVFSSGTYAGIMTESVQRRAFFTAVVSSSVASFRINSPTYYTSGVSNEPKLSLIQATDDFAIFTDNTITYPSLRVSTTGIRLPLKSGNCSGSCDCATREGQISYMGTASAANFCGCVKTSAGVCQLKQLNN